jgi:AraC-like DNA-binding protein
VEASRFDIAGALLQKTDLTVHEIAAQIGYRSLGAFARPFVRRASRTRY